MTRIALACLGMLSVACSRQPTTHAIGNSMPPASATWITLASPAELAIRVRFRFGRNKEAEIRMPLVCSRSMVTAKTWIDVLEADGFRAQSGVWDVPGELFGVRFRKGGLIGDLASERARDDGRCQSYVIRALIVEPGATTLHWSSPYKFHRDPGRCKDPDGFQPYCYSFFISDRNFPFDEDAY